MEKEYVKEGPHKYITQQCWLNQVNHIMVPKSPGEHGGFTAVRVSVGVHRAVIYRINISQYSIDP